MNSSEQIYQKIEELKQLAEQTNSSLLLMMEEGYGDKGKHIAAYGSGPAVKKLIVDSANYNKHVMTVLKAARDEAFPSPMLSLDESRGEPSDPH